MAKVLESHSFGCSFSKASIRGLPSYVTQKGQCQITVAPGQSAAALKGVRVTFYILSASADPSAVANQLFNKTAPEVAYGRNWVAEGGTTVYLGLANALGGTYPPAEQADLKPT